MEHAEPIAGRDAWDRLAVLWHLLFVLTLVIPTGMALVAGNLGARDRVVVATVPVGFAVLHWLVIARHPEWWERRLGVLAAYWIVACALAVVLASRHESYFILMYGLYPLMFMTLGWWGIVPIVGLTAMVGLAQGGWESRPALITNLLATAGVAMMVAVFITAISRQSGQRRDALNALAAARAELAEASRHAGVLAERERLARELHDTLAQGFTSVVTQLESAEQAFDERPGDAREHLAKARRAARDSLAEVRRTMRALRPELLEGLTLSQALDRVVREWSVEAGVPATLRTTGEEMMLSAEKEMALLRVTQEALANVAKHAAASRAIVSLSFLGEMVTLDVDDDGVGFSGEPVRRSDGGFGLIGMRERIATVGGELSIESAPGEGTTIAVSVPA
jgi:signal transduction histidine kinase